MRERWRIILTIGWLLSAGGIGFLSVFAAYLVTAIFDNSKTQAQVAGWIFLVVVILFFVAAIRRGYQESRGAVASTFAFAFTVSFTVPTLICNAAAGVGAFVISALSIYTPFSYGLTSIYAAILANLVMLLGAYVSWRTLNGTEKDSSIRETVVRLAATKGTTFQDADLAGANFSWSILQNTSFSNTNRQDQQDLLYRVCWQGAKKMNEAHVGNSILSNPAVRELLVTRNGCERSYMDTNLRGANLNGVDLLNGVNLRKANLKWADLSEATLHYADLRGADLTETLALGADFTGALLTGACLEAWNIDHTTILDNVNCQYVYLLRGQQERRPSSGDFAPGEFTKLFQEVLSTVDLIFRNGIDWKAFAYSFKNLVLDNEGTELSIQSIENKGDGVVVVRVNAPPAADKAKLHSEFNQLYETAAKALEAKYQTELQAKDDQITIYRQKSADMLEITRLMAARPINVQAIAEAKAMNDSTDQGQSFNVGGNFNIEATNSVVNLRDISGSVTNAINQLPDPSEPDQPNLKELLTELKAAIESDTNLPDTDKADLLEQVQELVGSTQTEEPAKKEGMARKAKKMFEATLKGLPDTAKIVEACSKLLPLVLKALGLPA